jgi:hypothetical protein
VYTHVCEYISKKENAHAKLIFLYVVMGHKHARTNLHEYLRFRTCMHGKASRDVQTRLNLYVCMYVHVCICMHVKASHDVQTRGSKQKCFKYVVLLYILMLSHTHTHTHRYAVECTH